MAEERFEKVMQILDLAVHLQSTRMGMTIDDIAEHMRCGPRTAQRLMSKMEHYFPQLEIQFEDSGRKRFRIPGGQFERLIDFSIDEIHSLNIAAQQLDRNGEEDDARYVLSATRKAQALMTPSARNRIAPDLEQLLKSEGLVASPGPRKAIPGQHLSVLREAIISRRVCEVAYVKQDGQEQVEKLHPYGLLTGHRHYLVCLNPARSDGRIRKIIIGNIRSVKLTDAFYEIPEDFDLQEYSSQSFGVFMDKIYSVEWVFSAKAAPAARDFVFHPGQQTIDNDDGSLTVKFEASGLQEMAWHLIMWGTEVDVRAPAELREMMKSRRVAWDVLP